MLDTETSIFGSSDSIKRGIAALSAPVSILAYGGTANWLSGLPSIGKLLIVDPITVPEYDLAALPSYQDQYFRSEILRKVCHFPLSSHESSLARLLRESSTVSLLELAYLQGLPPSLALSTATICYKTAACIGEKRIETLTLKEPYRHFQPWPSREAILASLMSEFLLV